MVERMCRACGAGNPAEATDCSACGADLEHVQQPLARRQPASLATRLRQLPGLSSPKARSVALGLAAIAVEVGASLLRERGKRQESPTTALAQSPQRHARAAVRQRVWEEFDADGRLRRRVVENVLLREDSTQ